MINRPAAGLVALLATSLVLGTEVWPEDQPAPPLTGFSFSPIMSEAANRDPVADLRMLLDATEPDLVRLPVYWEYVQLSRERLDFTSVDALMAAVVEHNSVSPRSTRVVLTVGARNFLYPELHAPVWAGPREQPYINEVQSGADYRAYFDASIVQYRDSPVLYAWQVENEPFDYVGNSLTGANQIDPAQLEWEFGEVRRLDPQHMALTTTYNGWNATVDMLQVYATPALEFLHGYPSGHPQETLDIGDALGLDLYLEGPSIPLDFTSVDLRAEWKQQTLAFWADRVQASGKGLWLTEMQAQPWGRSTGFTPVDLVESARDYREERLQVVLLWGVETWLRDPAWLAAGNEAMRVLRAT